MDGKRERNDEETPSECIPSSKKPKTMVTIRLFGVSITTEKPEETDSDTEVNSKVIHPEIDQQVLESPIEAEWTMKKTLAKSDCNKLSRLILGNEFVKSHILPHLNEAEKDLVESGKACKKIKARDCDVGMEFEVTLKKWTSFRSYVMMGNWIRDFVNRRGLKEGDEVGFSWDEEFNGLMFTVLKRKQLD